MIVALVLIKVRSNSNSEDILKSDVMESLGRVQGMMDILTHFKNLFEDKRCSLSELRKNGVEVQPWDFSPSLVFAGLDLFIQRLKMIEVIVIDQINPLNSLSNLVISSD